MLTLRHALRSMTRFWGRRTPSEGFFDVRRASDRKALKERFGITPWVSQAQDPSLARRPRRVYEVRPDLREGLPHALLPVQRGLYAAWLFEHGREEYGLTDAEIWAYLFELTEDRTCGLATTFNLTPKWQEAFPHGLTRFGWDDLKCWLAREHGLAAEWLWGAERPDGLSAWDEVRLLRRARPELFDASVEEAARNGNPEPILHTLVSWDVPNLSWVWEQQLREEITSGLAARPSANLIGYFHTPSGLQVELENNRIGLDRIEARTTARDIPMRFECEPNADHAYQDPELFDVSLIKSGAFEPLEVGFARSGFHPHPTVYRVAMWSWELELFPAELLQRAELADEFWGPTEFVAEAMRRANPGKPVRAMLPGLEVPEVGSVSVERFGIDPAKFLFFFMFDISSVMERKNPFGLIEAYRQAFPNREAQLAIKVTRGESRPEEIARLREETKAAGVVLIEELLPRGEVMGLLNACDAYVSLHRSEGVGLTLAEAMLLGKPVIATGYSGNLDFMNHDVSLLVDHDIVPLGREYGPYPKEACWAEPSVTHAAELMRCVYEDREFGRCLGEKASRYAREVLSLETAAQRMVARIEEIRTERQGQ